jgi:hypothetical protein
MIAKIEARQPRPKKTPWDGGGGQQVVRIGKIPGKEDRKTRKLRKIEGSRNTRVD